MSDWSFFTNLKSDSCQNHQRKLRKSEIYHPEKLNFCEKKMKKIQYLKRPLLGSQIEDSFPKKVDKKMLFRVQNDEKK